MAVPEHESPHPRRGIVRRVPDGNAANLVSHIPHSPHPYAGASSSLPQRSLTERGADLCPVARLRAGAWEYSSSLAISGRLALRASADGFTEGR
jgi:hypothetical protein